MGIIGIIGSLGMMGGGHNRLIRHGRGIGLLGCLLRLWGGCGRWGRNSVQFVHFFGVGGGVVVSLHQRFDEGAALPGKPAMMYIYKVYVRRACDDQIVLLTNQIEVIDHD